MDWQLSPYAFILLGGALVSAAVAVTAWKRTASAAGRALAFLMTAIFLWALAAALEAATANDSAKILLSKLQYLGIASSPVLMLFFAWRFSRPEARMRPTARVLLWIIPSVTMILAATNEWHRLIWEGYAPAAGGRYHLLVYDHGPFFWIHAAFSYGLLLATTIVLLRTYFRSRSITRRQALALLLALPWPWLGNVLYISGLARANDGHDYTPVGFAVSGLLLLWSLFRLRLVDLVPVAREKVIESMGESLIVLDEGGRVASMNPAARRLLASVGGPDASAPASKVIGRRASEVFSGWPELAESLATLSSGEKELARDPAGAGQVFEIRLSPLSGGSGGITGWVAVLYDITRLKRAERVAVEARRVAEILRDTGLVLSSSRDIKQMSAMILDLIRRAVAFDVGVFLMIEGLEMRLAGIQGHPEGPQMIGMKFPVAGCRFCQSVLQRGRAMAAAITGPDDTVLPWPPDSRIRSTLGVPVVFQEHVTGLIALYAADANHFTEEDMRVAGAFAHQAAIALENSRLFDQLNQLATTDNLTGLANRRSFSETGGKEFERARRYKRPLSLILFDIDHFKDVNDAHGHLVGDQVLRTLATTVIKTTRTTDTVCRYGGEEFIVLMPEAGRDQALAMAERLRQRISEMIVVAPGGTLTLTISLGVATLNPRDEALESLIGRADAAMYKAKAEGRNRVGG